MKYDIISYTYQILALTTMVSMLIGYGTPQHALYVLILGQSILVPSWLSLMKHLEARGRNRVQRNKP